MKVIRTFAGILCIAMVSARAADAPADPASAYEEAVKAYVMAASNEVQTMRVQADAAIKNATPDVKQRYADFYVQLELCEKLLAELKTAAPGDFDRIKAKYEQQRAVLVKARAKAEAR
jgi:hypothetical protein